MTSVNYKHFVYFYPSPLGTVKLSSARQITPILKSQTLMIQLFKKMMSDDNLTEPINVRDIM
jgi:hypothetical protein